MQFWFKGWHHFYLGLLMALLSFWLLAKSFFVVAILIFILSLWLLIDDYWQHFVQSIYDKNYHSPLHRIYGWIYSRCFFIRWLNKLTDKLFGR